MKATQLFLGAAEPAGAAGISEAAVLMILLAIGSVLTLGLVAFFVFVIRNDENRQYD
ncbi:MAG TPA: hypothetical protein PK098_11660 [Phycisphaerales bacterium]|nr:hypothetical protein [Phycisphaerales bacterium]